MHKYGWLSLPVILLCIAAVAMLPADNRSYAVDHKVQLVRPTDPSFESQLGSAFPGLLSSKTYQHVRPMLVLVSNLGAHHVMAFVVRWQITHKDGSASILQEGVMQEASNPVALSGQWTVLAPGRSQLVSPSFHWSEDSYTSVVAEHGVESYLRSVPTVDSDTIQPVIDGVAFDDATFIGSNESRLLERLTMERNGQRDEGLSLVRMIKEGKSNEEIRDLLKLHVYEGIASRGINTNEAFYTGARGREALRFQPLLLSGGRQDLLLRAAEKLAASPRLDLQRKEWYFE